MHRFAFPVTATFTLLITILLMLPLCATPLFAAQEIALPGEIPLGPKQLFLRFDDADIHLVVATGEDYVLRASYADEGTGAALEWALSEENGLTVQRSGVEGARLRLEVVMSPVQVLSLVGTNLDLTLEASQELRDTERSWGGISLELSNSVVNATALRDFSAKTFTTTLWLQDTAGKTTLTLHEESSIESSYHEGEIELIAETSQARFNDVSGEIQASLKEAWLYFEGDAASVGLAEISYAEIVLAAPCIADLSEADGAEVELSGCEHLADEPDGQKREGIEKPVTLQATVGAGSTLNVTTR